MRDFKAQNKCNIAGAWLMITLQGDEIPVPETVIVITFWFHYANVVVGQRFSLTEQERSRWTTAWISRGIY
jgi:hypothetical protein